MADFSFGIYQKLVDEMTLETGKDVIEVLEAVRPSLIDTVYGNLLKHTPDEYVDKKRELEAFSEECIVPNWSNKLSILNSVIQISFESVKLYREHNNAQAEQESSHDFLALILLHAKSILIAKEIQVLLESGFPDGAFARWRTLHELAVCSVAISNSPECGELFLLCEDVKEYKRMLEYNEHSDVTNYQPLTQSELDNIKEKHDHALSIVPEATRSDYAWARPFATSKGLGKSKRITFSSLEKLAGMTNFRPYYSLSCQSNHAHPRMNYASMGTSNLTQPTFLVGPSSTGFFPVIDATILSLRICTVSATTTYPNVDSIVYADVMGRFLDELRQESEA